MDAFAQLRARVAKAPASPGVYRWLNTKGDVLYVGKAKNLRNRLKSYVQKEADKSTGPWKLSLRKHIADFDVTVTSTELEALILETNLIKEIKPKYNVLMKDDKNYVYVRISAEEYPEVSVVRKMPACRSGREDDRAKYFGPYLSAYEIKRTLDTLHDIFHFRACLQSIEARNRGKQAARACMQEQIGQCNGLCVGAISQEQYQEAIGNIVRFLRGQTENAVDAVRAMMAAAAAEKKFEKAAKLRDTLGYITSLSEKQVVSDTSRDNTDAIGVALQNGKSQVVVLRQRGGKLIDERAFSLAGGADRISPVISELIPQYYALETDIPDLILIQEEIKDRAVLEQWLREVRGKKTEIREPERGKKNKLLQMAETNAAQKIAQQFAKWEAAASNIATALRELKDTLDLPEEPRRIEGYDISHLGGTETVGSMVVMLNGKSANKEYRSFTLRTVKEGEIDDYKALKEVLRRRLRYLSKEKERFEARGITLGKALKKEQLVIEEISNAQSETIGEDAIDYKDYTVARCEGKVIGFARLFERTKDVWQLRSVWVDEQHRGDKLGHLIIRTIINTSKLSKIYLTVGAKTNLESYYEEIGFERVITPPKIFQDLLDRFTAKNKPGILMVYIRSKHKLDNSLISDPDLLVIDGGKGQLSAVVEVLKELELQIPVIGLAKREEEVFVPGQSFPIDLPSDCQAGFLLQRLRDEAHRFANAHRENRLAKSMIGSALDAVPGIGEKTKHALLKKFGSVDIIKSASDTELLSVLSPAQLRAIRDLI